MVWWEQTGKKCTFALYGVLAVGVILLGTQQLLPLKLALWMEQHTNKAKQAGAGKEKKADETDKV